MNSETELSVPTPRAKITSGRVVLGCLVIPLILLAIGLTATIAWWVADNRKADQELAVEVQRVRGRGDSLSLTEVNDYYVAAPGRPDMTAQIVTALALCTARELDAQSVKLPLVGEGAKIPEPPAQWSQLDETEAYLKVLQPALDTFHDVARQEGTARYPADFTLGPGVLLPHLTSLRKAARVLHLQCEVDVRRDRPREAVEDVLAMLALARTLDQEPCLISQLVRVALHSVAIDAMQRTLRNTKVSDADLVRLQVALRKSEFETCLRRAFAGECASGYAACADLFTTDSPALAQLDDKRTPARRYDAAMILRNNNRIIEASETGLGDALREAKAVEAELMQLASNTHHRILYATSLLLSPASSKAVEAMARAAAQRDAADAAIAAELYRRRHGQWPTKMEQLVPDLLPAVPLDPFNNDQLLKVVATPEEFKVYSVGKDGQDNGGDFAAGSQPDVGFTIQTPQNVPKETNAK